MNLRLVPVALILVTLLAACGMPAGSLGPEELAAQTAILSALDETYEAQAAQDASDLSAQSLGSEGGMSTQSVDPFVVVRRTDMHRTRELLELTVDFQAEPLTATAEVHLHITGTAELWEVYPAAPGTRDKVGEKPIDMQGPVTVTAQKLDGRWRVMAVERSELSQGDFAAGVDAWSVSPDPLIAGSADNRGKVTLFVPETADQLLVLARGSRLHPRGVMHDNGTAPDAIANDDVYNGFVEVDAGTEAGEHLAFIHALNYSRTIDLTKVEGEYLYPYTDTLLPVTVTVAVTE